MLVKREHFLGVEANLFNYVFVASVTNSCFTDRSIEINIPTDLLLDDFLVQRFGIRLTSPIFVHVWFSSD